MIYILKLSCPMGLLTVLFSAAVRTRLDVDRDI